MSFVYMTEHGCKVGIDGGCLYIKHADMTIDNIPKEMIEGISIFAKVSITGQCIQFCLENSIPVSFFTSTGRYYGSLMPNIPESELRLRKQIKCTEDRNFALQMAKKFIYAKICNQIVVAKRYLKGRDYNAEHELFQLRNAKKMIERCDDLKRIMGYEGIASRAYFNVLSHVVEKDFGFERRNRRPAVDPFNAMLNFGYALLIKEINGELINRSLSPYIGFLHNSHEKSPALSCDLIEEWRSVIVDSTVMSLIQGHEICREMFEMKENRMCVIKPKGVRILVKKLEGKMHCENQYLSYIKKPVTFRAAIWHQVEKLGKTIETGNTELYRPIIIR